MQVHTAVGYKMVIPFNVSFNTGALPHVASATAFVAFNRGDVSPYNASAGRTGPGSIVVVYRCVVAPISCWFGVQLYTIAVDPLVV